MKQSYQNARKYYVEKLGLNVNTPFVEVAKAVVDSSNGKILFDVQGKEAAGQFLMVLRMREPYFGR